MKPLPWLLLKSSGYSHKALCRDPLAKRVCAIFHGSLEQSRLLKRNQIIGIGKPTFVSHQQSPRATA
jgi:hypothetical protein